jgi:hypothetical protein
MKFIYVVLTLLIVAITALPDSAFVCQLGGSSGTRQNSIEKGGYQVTLNGVTLTREVLDPGFYNIFLHGVLLSLSIQSSVGQNHNDIVVIASGGDIRNIDSLDTRTPQALTNSTPFLSSLFATYTSSVCSALQSHPLNFRIKIDGQSSRDKKEKGNIVLQHQFEWTFLNFVLIESTEKSFDSFQLNVKHVVRQSLVARIVARIFFVTIWCRTDSPSSVFTS